MDKKRIEINITAVLVLIMIIAWAKSCKVLQQRFQPKPAASVVTASSVTGRPSFTQPAAPPYKEEIEEKIAWGRDPFSGKIYSTSEGPIGLSLTGIIWDTRKPQVLIEDKICGIGDTINGCVVVDIQQNKVVLSDGVKQFELKLPQ